MTGSPRPTRKDPGQRVDPQAPLPGVRNDWPVSLPSLVVGPVSIRGRRIASRPDPYAHRVRRKTCADNRNLPRTTRLNRGKDRYSMTSITKRRLASLASASAMIATFAVDFAHLALNNVTRAR